MAGSLSSWQFGLEQSNLPRDKVIYASKICQEVNKPIERFQNKRTTYIRTWTSGRILSVKKHNIIYKNLCVFEIS